MCTNVHGVYPAGYSHFPPIFATLIPESQHVFAISIAGNFTRQCQQIRTGKSDSNKTYSNRIFLFEIAGIAW